MRYEFNTREEAVNFLEKYNFENIRRKFSKLPDKILNPSLWKE